jgi:hypothetical protein
MRPLLFGLTSFLCNHFPIELVHKAEICVRRGHIFTVNGRKEVTANFADEADFIYICEVATVN